MLKIASAALTLLMASSFNSAQAALVTFNFSGTIYNTIGVPNAGTTVSGFLTFDPSGMLDFGFPGGANYFQSAPATFFFTTNAGFVLQQTMTGINVADKFANGTADYYVFNADVGSFSTSTNFSRLNLTLSNNHDPFHSEYQYSNNTAGFFSISVSHRGLLRFYRGHGKSACGGKPDFLDSGCARAGTLVSVRIGSVFLGNRHLSQIAANALLGHRNQASSSRFC